MTNWIDSVLGFFADQTRRVSTKLLLGLSIIMLLWLIDNTFGFSYYYSNENKISQINKIQILLDNQKLDSNLKLRLTSLQRDVINRQSIKDYIRLSLRNIFTTNSSSNQNNNPISAKPIKNTLLFKVSAGGVYLLFIVFSPLLIFVGRGNVFKRGVIITFIMMFLFGITMLLNIGLGLIPIILNQPIYNYILNVLVQFSTLLLIYKGLKYYEKINFST